MDIKELISKTNEKLLEERSQSQTLEDYLSSLLSDFLKDVGTLDFTSIQRQCSISPDKIIDNIKDSILTISKVLDEYSHAQMLRSIGLMQDYISDNDMLLSVSIDPSKNDGKYWFRIRKQEKEKKVFPAKQMFHIPFQLRGRVNTQRYSLPGYPCLYISRSAWSAWEEMHEPHLGDFCISCLTPKQTFEVLDLRMMESEKMEGLDLAKVLCTMPLVIACSIKVLQPEDNFKPEYIVPQLVMLALVNDCDRVGCAYTSTRRNSFFNKWDIRKLDNIALPVKCIEKAGLCSKLCNYFQITDATNYEYELLKRTFEALYWVPDDDYGMHDEGEKYENSIFGQLEERLKEKDFHDLPLA